jgi:hypothetical protein
MAERKLIYSIKINGIDQEIKNVDKLSDSIVNLGDSVNTFSTSNIESGAENLENLNVTVVDTGDKFDEAGQSVQNFDNNLDNIDPTPLTTVNKNLDSTTEKVDKLTFAGEKGFKGISDALKLFGVDTSILDGVKEGLGAIGDLLDSQSKLSDVAFNEGPAVKQAEAIKDLTQAQTLSNTATETGAVATTAAGTATKGATIATQALNVALRALPFLAVIGAITAVISLYSQWKSSQNSLKKDVDGFLDSLNSGLDEYNSKLEEQIRRINNVTDVNEINNNSQISALEKQIDLLSQQEGNEKKIFEIKKQIIALQQEQLQSQIDLNQQLILLNNSQITANNNAINSLQTQVDLRKEEIKDLFTKRSLLNEFLLINYNIDLSEKDIKKSKEEEKKLEEEIKKIKKENADIEQQSAEYSKQILISSNNLKLSKQFDLNILAETNKLEQERLAIQKEQEKIKLSEELKKIGVEIFKNYVELKDFNEEFLRLYNELEQKVNKDKLKIAIDAGDFDSAFELLKKSLDNFSFETKNTKQDIFQNIIQPLINSKEALQNFIDKTKEELKIRLNLNNVKDQDINLILKNIEDKLKNLNFDISSSFEFNLPVDFQSEAINKIFKSNLESVENFSEKVINVREKVKNGITDLSPEEYFIFDLDKLSTNFNLTDGILNKNFISFLTYQIELKKSITSIKKDLDTEFKLKGFNEESIDSLNQFVNSLIDTNLKLTETNKKVQDISGDLIINQSAQLKVFAEKIKEAGDLLKSAEGNFDESLGNIQNIVNSNLEGLKQSFQNGGNLKFNLFLNKNLEKQLEQTYSEPVQMVIDDLNKKKEELIKIFNEIIKDNPEAGDDLKRQLDNLLKQIDDATKKLEGKKDENAQNVKKTFKEFNQEYGKLIGDTVQAASDLFTAINDLQIQSIQNQQKDLDEFYDAKFEKYDEEIERIQEFYDLQSQIASHSLSKINELENQLKNSRGSRSEFLLKLIASEQEKNQLAEKQKLDAIKREEKAKKEQAKAEEERASKQEELERKKFNLQKASNIAQIIVNGALAFTQALSSPPGPPATIPLAVIVGALSAVQLGIAASAKFAKGGLFAEGGKLDGSSHDQGGMPVLGRNGQKVAELEGGEYIINKRSTAANFELLEQINKNPEFLKSKNISINEIERFINNNNSNIETLQYSNNKTLERLNKNSEKYDNKIKIMEFGGIIQNLKQVNSQVPDFNTIVNNIQNSKLTNNQTSAQPQLINNVVASVDGELITSAIREGMDGVVIQASVVDINNINSKLIEIDNLRRI